MREKAMVFKHPLPSRGAIVCEVTTDGSRHDMDEMVA